MIPVIVLVGGVAAAGRLGSTFEGHAPVDLLTPGVLALAVMSTAFTSVAIATGFERRYGVIAGTARVLQADLDARGVGRRSHPTPARPTRSA